MAIDLNKFIMFFDVVALQKEGFTQKVGHGYDMTSTKLMTKLEVDAVWLVNTTDEGWTSLANNQWVARWRMTPGYEVPPPSPLPSAPVLTTTYPPPSNPDFNQCVLHEWTLSTPDVTSYELQTYDSGGAKSGPPIQYPIPGFSGRSANQCDYIPRNCEAFTFKIRAKNSVGYSAWSNITTATLKTEFPFFTNFTEPGSTTENLLWQYTGAYPAGHPTVSLTNDGEHFYQIQDNGDITCNIYSSPLTVAHKTETINGSVVHHQEDVYTRWNCYSGFISDDGKNALFITRAVNNVISHSTSTTGWAASMNFTRQLGVGPPITGETQCIKMNLDYTKVFVCKGSIIYEFSMNSAWDIASMSTTGTVDLSIPSLIPGYTFEEVEDYSFVNSGFGIVVRGRIAVTGQNDIAAVHYIELPTAFSLTNPIIHMIDGASFAQFGGEDTGARFAYPVIPSTPGNVCDEYGELWSFNDDTNYVFRSKKSR